MLVVPGMGSARSLRCGCQATAICWGVASCIFGHQVDHGAEPIAPVDLMTGSGSTTKAAKTPVVSSTRGGAGSASSRVWAIVAASWDSRSGGPVVWMTGVLSSR